MKCQVQLLLVALLLSAAGVSRAFNVLDILGQYPRFSQFRQSLLTTGVSQEIDAQNSVTILAVNDGSFGSISSLSNVQLPDALRNLVVLEYFGYDQLTNLPNGTTIVATLYQKTGRTQYGYVNITDGASGTTVGLAVSGAAPNATIIGNVTQQPYNISIVELSNAILPLGLQENAITNVSDTLTSGGFSKLLAALQATGLTDAVQAQALKAIVIFAPTDEAFNRVQSVVSTLTAEQLATVLELHVVPKYISANVLQSYNAYEQTLSGERIYINTTSGRVIIQSVSIATELATVVDKSPTAIYSIDTVLIPASLSAPTPAPAPALEGPSPTPSLTPVPATFAPEAPPAPSSGPAVAPAPKAATPTPVASAPTPTSAVPSPVGLAPPPTKTPSPASNSSSNARAPTSTPGTNGAAAVGMSVAVALPAIVASTLLLL